MTSSTLSIFAKDTDANASLRGYQYQILRTLETWLTNYANKIDEEIYCDYEEDIFQRDGLIKKIKFRQLKLYSSNFSFKSEEIEKALSHFFMLHIKTDYHDCEKEFAFEANSSVAAKYADNDADLLRLWSEKQDDLPEDLLNRATAKVKDIMTKYVSEQSARLKGKYDEQTISEAEKAFSSITNDDWKSFVKRIKWIFLNTSPEIEFSNTVKRIEDLLLKAPFDVTNEKLDSCFGLLHKEIALRASLSDSEQRKITSGDLEYLLLKLGEKEDKWYAEVHAKWKDIKSLEEFSIGEFYEIVTAVRYCRWHPNLFRHNDHWIGLLEGFANNAHLDKKLKRNVVYEYLWLKFRPIDEYTMPEGDLLGCEEYLIDYFKALPDFDDPKELEHAQNLLNISFASLAVGRVKLTDDVIPRWFSEYSKKLNQQLLLSTNPNELCQLLELESSRNLFPLQLTNARENIDAVIDPLNRIIENIEQANLYDVTRLSHRLNSYIKLLVHSHVDENSKLIFALDSFSNRLDGLVEKRSGSHAKAKMQVERGVSYLKSNNKALLLSALSHFHSAKDLWNTQETIEGYVLGLLNISQLYSAIDLNLAAKYYALGAAWTSIHNGNTKLLKRIADAFAFMCYSDFRQGAWMNTLTSIDSYFLARHEFKPNPVSADDHTTLIVLADCSILTHTLRQCSTQFHALVESRLYRLNYLREFVDTSVASLANDYPTENDTRALLEKRMTDSPLTDVGQTRYVRFNALGSLWEISFVNNYQVNPIAEEFCSNLQIIIGEIAFSNSDFHLTRGSIKLDLELADSFKPPERLPSNTEYRWRGFINFFDSANPQDINFNSAKGATVVMTVLEEVSLLPKTEFNELFWGLFKDKGLATKTLSANSYQRMYRFLFKEAQFKEVMREHFQPTVITMDLPKENEVMKWRSDKSGKYNSKQYQDRVIQRFKNSFKHIHLTVDKLKTDNLFISRINELRLNGWKDWQIVLAMMNFTIDHKAYRSIPPLATFPSEEAYLKARQDAHQKFMKLDESECYIEFPASAFTKEGFMLNLEQTVGFEITAIGLEANKSRFPNFPSLREFAEKRLFKDDEVTTEHNPIKDIIA
jgi:hypothetical protein